ncbi:MAG: germination protein YpeB [Clostridia bacterium]|nr:germination protein YpeB [Clostridia bacterium]
MEYEKNRATQKVEEMAENAEQRKTEEALTDEERSARELERTREEDAFRRMLEKERLEKTREENRGIKGKYGDGFSGGDSGDGKKKKRSAGGIGWAAAVIALGTLALIMTALFIISSTDKSTDGGRTSAYSQQAYYDFVNLVDAMDADMSKLLVSGDRKKQQKLLSELTVKSRLAADDVTRLPIKDQSKFYTTKFVNQIGDYSKYLNNKLIDGLLISSDDKRMLESLYETNGELKKSLTDFTAEMGDDYDFTTIFDEGQANRIMAQFDRLESNAVEYPKLIYDGPFSDALDEKTPKGLNEDEISLSQAEDIVKRYFADYGVTEVTAEGEGRGVIKTYNFDCALAGGDKMHVEAAKSGGRIVMFECYKDCKKQDTDLERAEEIADGFLKSLGFEDMSAVWGTEKGAVAYFNFVYTPDGIPVYPDMVKVTVCKERGIVSGMDAREYYLNHTKRHIEAPVITSEQAKNAVSKNLEQKTCRLAVVPYGETKEVLAYEISGTVGGATYYVYIDASDGKETEIFKVVETTEGTLLI